MHGPVEPIALVLGSIVMELLSETVAFSILPLTGVDASVRVDKPTSSILFVLLPVAFVKRAIDFYLDAASIPAVLVIHLTLIFNTVFLRVIRVFGTVYRGLILGRARLVVKRDQERSKLCDKIFCLLGLSLISLRLLIRLVFDFESGKFSLDFEDFLLHCFNFAFLLVPQVLLCFQLVVFFFQRLHLGVYFCYLPSILLLPLFLFVQLSKKDLLISLMGRLLLIKLSE